MIRISVIMKIILSVLFFVTSAAADTLTVNFDNGSWEPLVRRYGPNDNPAQQDTNYTVRVVDGLARFQMPAGTPGARMTGFLDLPASMVPVEGELFVEWTFTNVPELLGLGSATQIAIAGCYIRGDMNHWQGGLFGDYWGAMVYAGGQRVSALRQGNINLQSEPFTATQTASYRIRKTAQNRLQLWAKYDNANWHQVGSDVSITLNPNTAGASYNVAVTHVRVLDLSGKAVDVAADDFLWYGDNFPPVTDIAKEEKAPAKMSLPQNYPNPFNARTYFNFTLKEKSNIILQVYDLTGRKIAEIMNENKETGAHRLEFNAVEFGLSGGIYFYRLQSGETIKTGKMMVVR